MAKPKGKKKMATGKRSKKPMKGGVSASTHYSLYPNRNVNPTYTNPTFDKINRFVEFIDPFMLW